MNFKSLISLLFLVMIAIQGNAQIVIIDASLKNILGPSQESAITPDNVPDSLKEWMFDKCSTRIINGSNYLNVHGSGYVTTAPIIDVNGNIIVSAIVYPSVNNQKIDISIIGDEELESKSTNFKDANKWLSLSPQLLRNTAKNMRIKFTSNSDFTIVNLMVKDIGDGIYYESFNRFDGGGGNDGDFTCKGIANFNPSNFDNPTTMESLSLVRWASRCLYFESNGKYTTNKVPLSDTKDFILSFRTAGRNDKSKLKVTYSTSDSETKTIDFTESLKKEEWSNVSIVLPNFICGKNLTFSGDYVYLDDVLISETNEVCLNEKVDFTELLNNKVNHTVNASLARTFKANIWNTCCLPFIVTEENLREAANDPNLIIEIRALSSIIDGVFKFTPVSSIPAGMPFILQVNHDIVNPTFRFVSLTCSKPFRLLSKDRTYGFQGVFSPTALNTDGTHVFIGIDGKLHTPTDNNVMNGMRAYMIVPKNADARMVFMDEEVTDLQGHTEVQAKVFSETYNIMGQRIEKLKKGLNIKNGKIIFVR